jgi:gluconate kinase
MTNQVLILMGVSGCGKVKINKLKKKTTIGKELSKELAIPFFDGDDFHPKENIEKMLKGFGRNSLKKKNFVE